MDKCRARKCGHECQKYCPRVRAGDETVIFPDGPHKPPLIQESLCSGEGICIIKCPFRAIKIENTPEILDNSLTHRFAPNAFALFRLPIIRDGVVTGLVGQNGMGKSTALEILSGELVPNLGDYGSEGSWESVSQSYKGSELQNFFEKVSKGDLKCIRKPQYVDLIPRGVEGIVGELVTKFDERGLENQLKRDLGMDKIWERELNQLSGGELQKFAIAVAVARDSDLYLFDEPSSFLDVSERLRVGRAIRRLSDSGKTVVVVEHDLAILDYLSDHVCIFYGEVGVYGIVSHPHGVREGINIYLDGYLPDENMRFRQTSIKIPKSSVRETTVSSEILLGYPTLEKRLNGFVLNVKPGQIHRGEIIGIFGPNGIGKTTFVRMLAGLDHPTSGSLPEDDSLKVSHKPQYISATDDLSVMEYLIGIGKATVSSPWFKSEVLRPFGIERLQEQDMVSLSGGELQKVTIAAALAQDTDLYLFDEPSAYLSVEDRLTAAKIIRKYVQTRFKAAFIVEHDIVFQDYASDSLMVILGKPAIHGVANPPRGLREGMNSFLKELEVTFRRDGTSGRPRVNKPDSKLDKEQRLVGEYYYV